MADDVHIRSLPTRRKPLDVATELTQMYLDRTGVPVEPEEIQMVFLKFFVVAEMADRNHWKNFIDYLPSEIKEIAKNCQS